MVWPMAALLVCGCLQAPIVNGEPDLSTVSTTLAEVPNPLSGENSPYPLLDIPLPGPGGLVNDERLGTVQVRVTETPGLRHEYSRFDPFNADGTRVLLMALADGAWRVYKTGQTPYDRQQNLIREISGEEPRWDNANPNLLWATEEFRILQIDVAAGDSTTVKDFRDDPVIGPILRDEPDLYRITMKDEGEASLDRRYWAFMLQGMNEDYRARYLFVWDRQEDRVIGTFTLAADQSRIDWVGMSPLGNWVIIGSDFDNAKPLAGLVLADRTLTKFQQIHTTTGHADVGLDAAGREVIVMQNAQTDYVDLITLDNNARPALSDADYPASGHVPLMRLFYASDSPVGLNSGVHVSCNCPGWCVVSTTTDEGAPEQNWLDRTITLVRLDRERPQVFYLAKVYGTRGSYWEETQATISRDGSRVVWATNWNTNVGQDKVWVMELRVPNASR
jgi:hypothetical protein